MASAFIVQVQPQLQSDPNQETAALLRVLIYKIDNTTFKDAPALPQWTGPPRTIVHVQSILYASLAASLLSAFLAMLGKQWLNRYATIEMRGSAIQRSQNRQRKLDGVVAWYFDHVMESIPSVLQVALLLLGCALSKYLWVIDTTVASVVLGVTSFGILFDVFVIVAGMTSEGCPYQTLGANLIPRSIHSARVLLVKHSVIYDMSVDWWKGVSKGPATKVILSILLYVPLLLLLFLADTMRLGRATFRSLVLFARWTRRWRFSTSPVPDRATVDQTTKLDLRCILWMLRTSLDKTINTLTLNFLATILPPAGFDPSTNTAAIVECFNILTSCFVTTGGIRGAMVARGSEQLARISATCFLRTFSCLLSTEPTSAVVGDIRQRYESVFPFGIDMGSLQCPAIMSAIHNLIAGSWRHQKDIDWRNYQPSVEELVSFSRVLAQVAKFEYHKGDNESRTPCWLVCFALRFLSQEPLPPPSVVVDCLTIIAVNLGYNVSDTNNVGLDKRCVCTLSPVVPFFC